MGNQTTLWVRDSVIETGGFRRATRDELVAAVSQIDGARHAWFCAAAGVKPISCDRRHGWQDEDNPKCGPVLVIPVGEEPKP